MKLRSALRLSGLLALGALAACTAGEGPDAGDESVASEKTLTGSRAGENSFPTESDTADEPAIIDGAPSTGNGPTGTAKLTTETGEIEVPYEIIDGDAIAEGDVVVPTELQSATITGRRWTSAVVPYVIEANLPDQTRVTGAIAHWQATTNLRFVPRTTQGDYVTFHPGTGCSSMIGKQGGKQTINLATGETPSSVVGIGIDRTSNRTYYFYKRGFATAGSTTRVDAVQGHFKYSLPAGKLPTDVVEVAFAGSGHLIAWYTDGTVSEGTPTDFAKYVAPVTYTLAPGKTPADVAAFAFSRTDQAHAFYKDGTYSVGTARDLDSVAAPAAFTVAAGKTAANLAHVDVSSSGAFYAFYTDGKNSSGTAAQLGASTALANVAYPGHCALGQTIHEIGHAIGFFHEQTRQDRDRFVKINFANVASGQSHNFQKYSSGSDNGAYDFDSVMHYSSYAFSANGQPTITKLDGTTVAGQRRGLSVGDIASAKGLYPTVAAGL